jgi:hypothetical protein
VNEVCVNVDHHFAMCRKPNAWMLAQFEQRHGKSLVYEVTVHEVCGHSSPLWVFVPACPDGCRLAIEVVSKRHSSDLRYTAVICEDLSDV